MDLEQAKDSLRRYSEDKIPTGGFLRKVLENDLMGAVGKADPTSYENLKDIIIYMLNHLPADSWGSKEQVNKWLNS